MLDDAPAALQLPADRSRPSALGGERGQHRLALPAALRAALERLAADTDTSPSTVLLSAWQALLARYTDEADIVVGCPAAPLAEAEGGADPAVLVVRTEVQRDRPFRELLRATAQTLDDALAMGARTVDQLLTELGAEPGRGKHPVFQVGFVQQGPSSDAQAGWDGAPAHAPCDVVLRWDLAEEGIVAELDYATELFDARRIQRMAAHLELLLGAAVTDPDIPVGRLPLLTDEERALLARWNDTAAPHDASRSLAALFAERTTGHADAVAVELGGQQLTYAELDARANRLARALQDRGVGPDVTVAVSMDRSLDLVVAVLGVLKAGGAYVPVDPAYPPARRTYMLEDSHALLLLVQDGGQVIAPDGVTVLTIDQALSGAPGDGSAPTTAATGADLGYVIYTSGSTGQPKGVQLPQAALTNLIEWQVRQPGFAQGRRTLQFSSLSFDVSFQELFSTWCSGGTLVLVAEVVRRDPRSLLEHLIATDVERIFLPFVALRGLADAAVSSGRFPSRLREVYTAGEQLQVDDTLRAFFAALPDCRLENQYGPSESHVVTAHPLAADPSTWPALPPIGKPVANTSLAILDAGGELRPPGIPGELYIGGVCLARGYANRPDLTAERFVTSDLPDLPARLYRTGDLARWREDGAVEFLGRVDNQVKFRGFRIEPGEVGAVLSGYPGVRQCVATIADVPGVGPRLAAYVLPVDGATVALDELHRYAREQLPDYMVPSHVMLVDELPMTPSGKVDTQALPEPAFDRRILSSDHVPPRSPEEQALAEIWQALLGVSDIGVHDDFFELGGDSLMAVEMFVRIEERLGRSLPLGALAAGPTIAALAGRLSQPDGAEDASYSSLVPLRTDGAGRPVFFVHGGTGNVASFPRLARELPADRPAYALQWDGLDGSRGSGTIEEMADKYLAIIRSVQPTGPYDLVGQCIGGLVGMEMSHRLRAEGETVSSLVMYDSPNVFSPHFKILGPLPNPPERYRPLVNRLMGAASNVARFVLGKRPRGSFLRVRVLSALRRPVRARNDREHHGEMMMLRAAWRYRPRPVADVPVTFIHTGLSKASKVAMAGRWTDGMLGWSDFVSESFVAHHVDSGHSSLPYKPEAIELLNRAVSASDSS